MAPAAPLDHLTLAEWAILGLLGCGQRHGFALVKALAPQGEVGRIWSVPTPVVYRAIHNLRAAELIETVGAEPSDAGPTRTLLGLTPHGKQQLDQWVKTPVAHMRDVRGQLLLKLAVLAQLGRSPRGLATAQLRRFQPLLAALEARAASAEPGFETALAQWRVESARGTMRFLAGLAEQPVASGHAAQTPRRSTARSTHGRTGAKQTPTSRGRR